MDGMRMPARRAIAWIVVAALAAWTLAGCGSAVDRLLANESLRDELWVKVAANPELQAQLVDRLLSADSTREALLDRVMASGGARQRLLASVAKDRTLMDGAIHYAVQDTAMKEHLTTLFRGIEMGGAAPAPPPAP
jgi:hypothetical protein